MRIRPVTFAELEDYLEHLANPTQRPPLPRARVVGITSPQPGFLDQHSRPGRSAIAEYRRRRTADWQSWQPTLPLRIAETLGFGPVRPLPALAEFGDDDRQRLGALLSSDDLRVERRANGEASSVMARALSRAYANEGVPRRR